jgi:glycerol-3-phosphate dehydrogenase
MAEQTVDRVVETLKLNAAPTRTADEPLLPAGQVKFSGIVPPGVSREAVEHFCTREWALHLDDVMVRRSSWAYYDAAHDDEAERVSHWMAELLGWDEERRVSELEAFRALPLWPATMRSASRAAKSSTVGASR